MSHPGKPPNCHRRGKHADLGKPPFLTGGNQGLWGGGGQELGFSEQSLHHGVPLQPGPEQVTVQCSPLWGKNNLTTRQNYTCRFSRKKKKKYPVRKVASYGKDGGDDFSQQLHILVGPGFLIVCTFHHRTKTPSNNNEVYLPPGPCSPQIVGRWASVQLTCLSLSTRALWPLHSHSSRAFFLLLNHLANPYSALKAPLEHPVSQPPVSFRFSEPPAGHCVPSPSPSTRTSRALPFCPIADVSSAKECLFFLSQ